MEKGLNPGFVLLAKAFMDPRASSFADGDPGAGSAVGTKLFLTICPKIPQGIAFPCCISVNEVLGHFSPLKGESKKLQAVGGREEAVGDIYFSKLVFNSTFCLEPFVLGCSFIPFLQTYLKQGWGCCKNWFGVPLRWLHCRTRAHRVEIGEYIKGCG